jgi:hypothetical protein
MNDGMQYAGGTDGLAAALVVLLLCYHVVLVSNWVIVPCTQIKRPLYAMISVHFHSAQDHYAGECVGHHNNS